jgi:hypothetical protein
MEDLRTHSTLPGTSSRNSRLVVANSLTFDVFQCSRQQHKTTVLPDKKMFVKVLGTGTTKAK